MADARLEKKFFELFVQKAKASRFVERIESAKRREKIWDDLRDTRYFEPSCVREVSARESEASQFLALLRSLGLGPTVYVMSSDDDFDGEEAPLETVMESLWDVPELIGFSEKAKLGFFKNHEDSLYILRR